ncbi:transcription termination factor, mitochondrial isoform X2 [Cephus cinctus]|uniref:Transcription termination factor, mitochondrial isoform X2 n=1 Tax=Cephus cinctus TaxID=211228 RepID=A0AAJ7W156_CEPCN|nr:transcription termination factor, mitochondrial isoform X2 [Cephus cinctus]
MTLYFKIKELRTLVTLMKIEDNEVPNISRIHYLSEKLQCPLTTMCNILMKHKYLLKIPFQRIKGITDILIGHGVTAENILNDLWVFRYKENTVLMRVKKAIEAGVNPIKPWVVRCPESALNEIFRRNTQRHKALEPYTNIIDFLAAKLQCSKQDAEDFVDRNPAIYKMDPWKLKNVIQFLFDKEYKPEHLMQTPRLLYFGYKTILNRYIELELLKMKPTNLRVLCKSNAEIEDYIQKHKSMRIPEEQLKSAKEEDGISN